MGLVCRSLVYFGFCGRLGMNSHLQSSEPARLQNSLDLLFDPFKILLNLISTDNLESFNLLIRSIRLLKLPPEFSPIGVD